MMRGLQNYTPAGPDECWLWRGYLAPSGYGQMGWRDGKVWAHRMVYEDRVGPIPPGMHLDHLCCNKACVNPAHLEPVTHAENQRRAALARIGTPRRCGHVFEGSRDCPECARRRAAKNRERAKAARRSVAAADT